MFEKGKTKIFFRGDSRKPDGIDGIFSVGFKNRHPQDCAMYINGGIRNAVCLSARLSMASYFPLIKTPKYDSVTWIYAVVLNISEDSEGAFFNTHKVQVLDQGVHEFWGADEVAVKKIITEDIPFAVKCTRQFNSNHFSTGGTYKISSLVSNPNISAYYNPETITQLRKFLEEEINAQHHQGPYKLPLLSSGYNRNEPHIISESPVHSFFATPAIEKTQQEEQTQCKCIF